MIINVDFDTQTKALNVTLDGKKMDDISEVVFMNFGEENGSVEIRQCELDEEEKCYKVTKIMANEQGEYTAVAERDNSPLINDMVKVLFRGRK